AALLDPAVTARDLLVRIVDDEDVVARTAEGDQLLGEEVLLDGAGRAARQAQVDPDRHGVAPAPRSPPSAVAAAAPCSCTAISPSSASHTAATSRPRKGWPN